MNSDQPVTADDLQRGTLDARRALLERFKTPTGAISADGHTFRFQCAPDVSVPLGGYLEITIRDGRRYLGQVTDRRLAEREGPRVAIDGLPDLDTSAAGMSIGQTSVTLRMQEVVGSGVLLGRLGDSGITSTGPDDVFEDSPFTIASPSNVTALFASRTGTGATLAIGHVRFGDDRTVARLLPAGFSRHTFLCGQSGSGKTFSLGVTLERLLLETDLPMVIIDPNSDFVRIGEMRPYEDVARGFRDGLSRDEYEHLRSRYDEATRTIRVLRRVPRGVSDPNALRIRFSDLTPMMQGVVLQLDPIHDREEMNAFIMLVESLGTSDYSLADIRVAAGNRLTPEARNIALRIDNLGVAEWDIWAEAGDAVAPRLLAPGQRGVVLDIGNFEQPLEKSLVSAAALGLLWRERARREPVLTVIDEAHNVCPQEPTDPIQAIATERAIRIAGEGRKFGLYMLLSTQRPQKLHVNVLSQCDNLILMRMNSASDLVHLRETFSFVPGALFERASTFGQGEALIAGKIAAMPMLARFGGRLSHEGGSDVPTSWVHAE